MNIKQREDKTLRSYITRFNKEAFLIDEADDKILVPAFTNGLQKGKFLFSLYKNDPKAMPNVLYRATKYVMRYWLERRNLERGKDRRILGKIVGERWLQREDRHSKHPTGKFTSFTPLTTSIDQVLMQIKDKEALTFLGKLKGNPSKRSRDKYCHFYHDHGHDTTDCYDLK